MGLIGLIGLMGLMGDKPCAIDFEDEDVVDYPCFSAIYEADAALVAVGVDRGADAGAFIYVSCLGEELDVERHSLGLDGGLGMDVAYILLACKGIYPFPLFGEVAEVGVGLGGFSLHAVGGCCGGSWRDVLRVFGLSLCLLPCGDA